MISSGRYPLMRAAPAFHVRTWPVGSSMKIAYSVTCSTSNRKRSGATGGGGRPTLAGASARVTTPHHNLRLRSRATPAGVGGGLSQNASLFLVAPLRTQGTQCRAGEPRHAPVKSAKLRRKHRRAQV